MTKRCLARCTLQAEADASGAGLLVRGELVVPDRDRRAAAGAPARPHGHGRGLHRLRQELHRLPLLRRAVHAQQPHQQRQEALPLHVSEHPCLDFQQVIHSNQILLPPFSQDEEQGRGLSNIPPRRHGSNGGGKFQQVSCLVKQTNFLSNLHGDGEEERMQQGCTQLCRVATCHQKNDRYMELQRLSSFMNIGVAWR